MMRSDLSRQISFLDSSRRCNHKRPLARLEPNTQTRLDVKTSRKKKMSGGNRLEFVTAKKDWRHGDPQELMDSITLAPDACLA
jgi:hypothetical protein